MMVVPIRLEQLTTMPRNVRKAPLINFAAEEVAAT